MPGVPATAPDPIARGDLTPVNAPREASLTTERNLFDYLAQQALTNSLGNASTLANPSALASQLSRHLRGFMERSTQQAEISGKKGRAMSQDEGTQTVSATQAEGPQLHAGPARQHLMPSEGGGQRTEAVGGVSERELDDIVDALTRSMHFMVEANALVTGSSNVMKSLQTIMRGQ